MSAQLLTLWTLRLQIFKTKHRTMPSLDLPPRSFERVVLESTLWTVMGLAGFLGNILVLIACFRNPVLQKLTPVYVTALAITDILNFLTNAIFVDVTLITGGWQFGSTGCVISAFSSIFLIYASVSTMSLAAINRCIRATKPGLFKSIFAPTPSIVILAGMWFMEAMIVLVPFVMGGTKFIFHAGYAICVPSYNDTFKIFTTITHVSVIIASLLIVPVCYFKVHRALKQVHVVQESQTLQEPLPHVMYAAKETQSALQQDEQTNHQPEVAIRPEKEPSNPSQPVESWHIPQQQEPAKMTQPLKQVSPQKEKERKPQGTQRPEEIVGDRNGKAFKTSQPAEPQDNRQSGELQVTRPQERHFQKFASYKRRGACVYPVESQTTYQQQRKQQTREQRTWIPGTSAIHRPKSGTCKGNQTLITVQLQLLQGTHQAKEKQDAHQTNVVTQQEQQTPQPVKEPGDGQYTEGVLKAKEAKITKMMFAIVVAFTLIWIPLFFVIIMVRITLGTLSRDFMMLASYGSNLSSLINPVLYAIMNRSYRKEYKFILWSILRYVSDCFRRCQCCM